MLFRQRHVAGPRERLRLYLWPRVSWRRSFEYYVRRILRLSGTPYAIAMGTAIGAGVGLTPFIGFHFLLTFAIAWLLRGNLIAGALGSCIANPLTYPVIWAGTYQLGHLILEGHAPGAPPQLEHQLMHRSLSEIVPLIEPMVVGSIPIALAVGSVVYVLVYRAVAAYQAGVGSALRRIGPPERTRSAMTASREERRNDRRHRQRPHRHPPRREDAGALRRALHRAGIHRYRAPQIGAAAAPARPPTRSASRRRRRAPRRSAPG